MAGDTAAVGASTGTHARGAAAAPDGVDPQLAALAQRSFPHDPALASRLATALAVMASTNEGAPIARFLAESDITFRVEDLPEGMGAQYRSAWSIATIGENIGNLVGGDPLDRSIVIDPEAMEDPATFASVVAHEAAHFQLAKKPLVNLPIWAGMGVGGVAGMLISLPTLGMFDLTGKRHAPGVGAIVAGRQGAWLVSSMTLENRAYRAGDRVAVELGADHNGWIFDDDARERGALSGGWEISKAYMDEAAYGLSDSPPAEHPLRGLAITVGLNAVVGGALYLGARKFLNMSPRSAISAAIAPGALATAAGLLLKREDIFGI